METANAFDLNQAIQRWRENLAQAPALRPENLDELESHLRDSIGSLQTAGLSAEEAFIVAIQRMGKAGVLESEFAKVNGQTVWLDRTLWMLIGVQLWGMVFGLVGSLSTGALSLGLVGGNFDFTGHGRTLAVLLFTLVRLLAIAGSLAICWWLIARNGHSLGSRMKRFLHTRMMLALTCGILGIVAIADFALRYGPQILISNLASLQSLGEVAVSLSYSNWFGWIIQTSAMIGLTMILARQHIRRQASVNS